MGTKTHMSQNNVKPSRKLVGGQNLSGTCHPVLPVPILCDPLFLVYSGSFSVPRYSPVLFQTDDINMEYHCVKK